MTKNTIFASTAVEFSHKIATFDATINNNILTYAGNEALSSSILPLQFNSLKKAMDQGSHMYIQVLDLEPQQKQVLVMENLSA